MYDIEGKLDPGIAPVVKLLRRKGLNTFASCEGGPGHAFERPTVRIEPDNLFYMLPEVGDIPLVLSEAGYSGYSIKEVHAFQNKPTPWTGPPGLNYIEVEFWQYPLEHPAKVFPLAGGLDQMTAGQHAEPSATDYYSLIYKESGGRQPEAWDKGGVADVVE